MVTHKLTRSAVQQAWARSNPDLDTSPMTVIGYLKDTIAGLQLAIEPVYAVAPVSPSELDVLIPLRHLDEPVIARALAQYLGVTTAAMSKTLQRLETRGLVVREPSPIDRRTVHVTISDKARPIVDELFPRQLQIEAAILESQPGLDQQQVVAVLRALASAMRSASLP